jgi:hypothetical protein
MKRHQSAVRLITIIVVIILLSYAYTWKQKGDVLSTAHAPLVTSYGNPIVLDFNTPTPTPTPTPSPTLTPTPTPTLSPTPTSTPTPTSMPVSSTKLDEWFTHYANHYSIDRSLLWRIAVCESGLRPNATNWIYGGLYQFSPNTWSGNRRIMGLDPDPELRFHPEEAIKTAAFLLSTRGPGAWPNCSLKK